ncbi:MAG: hypothetical protein ABIY51_00490 [Ferruginibacter sp.]
MTIAVHISHTDEQGSVFLQACFSILVRQHHSHQFIFFKEKNQPAFLQENNASFINISPAIKNNLLLHYWYNYKLPALLQKNNVVLFINDNAVTSLRSTVKQCMIIKDLENIQHLLKPGTGRSYAKKFFPKFLSNANIICTSSLYLTDKIQQYFPATAHRLHTINHGLSPHYKPISFDEKQQVQDTCSNGLPYFYFEVTKANAATILPLLKAFSQFKKWQRSSFRLLLLYKGKAPAEPVADFKNYKYQEDVILMAHGTPAEAARIMAASYAVIYLPAHYLTGFTGLHAMRCQVPLISSGEDFCQSLFGDAAVYCKTVSDDIAKQMMIVYKDEGIYKSLVKKGTDLSEAYSWKNTADLLWNACMPE